MKPIKALNTLAITAKEYLQVEVAVHQMMSGTCPSDIHYECDLKLIEEHPESLSDYQLTERYMQELEKTIQRAPAYWLWSHDRWSRTKEEFDIRFYVKDGKVFEKMTEEEYAKTKGWKSYWHH